MMQLSDLEIAQIKQQRLKDKQKDFREKLERDHATALRLRDRADNITDNQRWTRVAAQIEMDISAVNSLGWRP